MRKPRNYDGSQLTTRKLSDVLPQVLHQVNETFSDRPDLILAAWPEIIGPHLAPMTQAVSFAEGVLTVKVKNSSLYALLSTNDKPRLVREMRLKFPRILIKTILFRIG